MYCKKCGAEISDGAKQCSKCGYEDIAQSIETSKNKKEKEITQEELSLIYQEINEAFIEAMQELLEQYPSLTQDDLYYCILNYLQLSNNTIKVCMKAGSQSALTQRKYRIKKQLSDLSFSIIFDAKGESK